MVNTLLFLNAVFEGKHIELFFIVLTLHDTRLLGEPSLKAVEVYSLEILRQKCFFPPI